MCSSAPGSLYEACWLQGLLELVKLRGGCLSLQDHWPFIQAAVLLELAEGTVAITAALPQLQCFCGTSAAMAAERGCRAVSAAEIIHYLLLIRIFRKCAPTVLCISKQTINRLYIFVVTIQTRLDTSSFVTAAQSSCQTYILLVN